MAIFKNEKKTGESSSSNLTTTLINDTGLTCIIAKGTVIEGKLRVSENIRVDGKIIGELFCEKRLVMDTEGIVEGNIYAGEATIKGQVFGTIEVINTLHLLETSYIKGDIKTKKLHVEEGARYDGKVVVGDVK